MASMIITECVAKVNIADVVFEAVETSVPDDREELDEVLDRVRSAVSWDLFRELEVIINMTIGQAMEDGFHIGWELRGKA